MVPIYKQSFYSCLTEAELSKCSANIIVTRVKAGLVSSAIAVGAVASEGSGQGLEPSKWPSKSLLL